MKEEIKNKLDALFAKAAAQKQQAEKERDLEAEGQAAFLASFQTIRDEVIMPAFREFGAYVESHNWHVELKNKEEEPAQYDRHGRVSAGGTSATCSIEFQKIGRKNPNNERWPHFSVSCKKQSRQIDFFESTVGPGHGGYSGPTGGVGLDDISKDFIQEKLLTYFTKLM